MRRAVVRLHRMALVSARGGRAVPQIGEAQLRVGSSESGAGIVARPWRLLLESRTLSGSSPERDSS